MLSFSLRPFDLLSSPFWQIERKEIFSLYRGLVIHFTFVLYLCTQKLGKCE